MAKLSNPMNKRIYTIDRDLDTHQIQTIRENSKGNIFKFNLAIRLNQILASRNRTQGSLAEETGISEASISDYLKGKAEPSANNLLKIANALNVSCDLILRNVKADNLKLHRATGLRDEAIDALKSIQQEKRIFKKIGDDYGNDLTNILSDIILHENFQKILRTTSTLWHEQNLYWLEIKAVAAKVRDKPGNEAMKELMRFLYSDMIGYFAKEKRESNSYKISSEKHINLLRFELSELVKKMIEDIALVRNCDESDILSVVIATLDESDAEFAYKMDQLLKLKEGVGTFITSNKDMVGELVAERMLKPYGGDQRAGINAIYMEELRKESEKQLP